jgi:hypothetical protein
VETLEKETQRLRHQLKEAGIMMEVQKKFQRYSICLPIQKERREDGSDGIIVPGGWGPEGLCGSGSWESQFLPLEGASFGGCAKNGACDSVLEFVFGRTTTRIGSASHGSVC